MRALRKYKVTLLEYFLLITIYNKGKVRPTIDGEFYGDTLRHMAHPKKLVRRLTAERTTGFWHLTDAGHELLDKIHVYAEDSIHMHLINDHIENTSPSDYEG